MDHRRYQSASTPASASAGKVLIQHHPYLSSLLVAAVGDVVQLHSVSREHATDRQSLEPHPRTFTLLDSVPVQQLTCLQCNPNEHRGSIVAVGTQQGRVNLVKFKTPHHQQQQQQQEGEEEDGGGGGGGGDTRSGIVQTFAPKAVRLCTDVAWNPRSPSQIAVGLEKLRSDPSLLIYDTNSHDYESSRGGANLGGGGSSSFGRVSSTLSSLPSLTSPVGSHYMHGATSGGSNSMGTPASFGGAGGNVQYPRPLASLALSEGVTALAWKVNVPHVLIYGTSSRWLRVHDLRGSTPGNALSICAHSRNVQGLTLNPWHPEIVATFSDGLGEPVKIWDLRKVDSSSNPEPLVSFRPTLSGLGGGPPAFPSSSSSSQQQQQHHTPYQQQQHFVSSSSSAAARRSAAAAGGGGSYNLAAASSISSSSSSSFSSTKGSSGVVTNVAWSPVKEGVLAVTMADDCVVSLWDVGNHPHPAAPFHTQAVSSLQPITSLSWQPTAALGRTWEGNGAAPPGTAAALTRRVKAATQEQGNGEQEDDEDDYEEEAGRGETGEQEEIEEMRESICRWEEMIDLAVPNRLVVATRYGGLEELSVHEYKPLALSRAGGGVILGCGRLLLTYALSDHLSHPAEMDISLAMAERASVGYSTDLGKNIQIMADEADEEERPCPGQANSRGALGRKLSWVWTWVDRIEEEVVAGNLLPLTDNEETLGITGLENAGILDLLKDEEEQRQKRGEEGEREMGMVSPPPSWVMEPSLSCPVWLGEARRIALRACGWSGEVATMAAAALGRAEGEEGQGSGAQNDADEIERTRGMHQRSENEGDVHGGDDAPAPVLSTRPGLDRIMLDCEGLGQYERAACLAVMHGDLTAAVGALQRGVEALQRLQEQEQEDQEQEQSEGGRGEVAFSAAAAASYAELLQLVAMCIAGYLPPPALASAPSSALWRSMCRSLLARPTLVPAATPASGDQQGVAYLRAACFFLYAISEAGSSPSSFASKMLSAAPTAAVAAPHDHKRHHQRMRSYSEGGASSPGPPNTTTTPSSSSSLIPHYPDEQQPPPAPLTDEDTPFFRLLFDNDISLADRTAFACQFLPAHLLTRFLRQEATRCTLEGDVEGILLTGMGCDGLRLLQAYVDRTGDVQTAALLTCRVPEKQQAPTVVEWIDTYRDFLNGGRQWHERATFDVGRATVLNEKLTTLQHRLHQRQQQQQQQQQQELISQGPSASSSSPAQSAPATATATKEHLPLLSVPPQLYVRCNFCHTAIHLSTLRRQGRTGQSWLSRQKPVLSCCPECRKPLPRCYICLLPMGALNPYLELRRQIQRHQQAALLTASSSSSSGAAGGAADKVASSSGGHAGGDDGTNSGDLLTHDAMASLSGLRFPEWFTWCHSCGHGAHATCILSYFETHESCGVAGCSCRCMRRDQGIYGGGGGGGKQGQRQREGRKGGLVGKE